MIPTLYPIFQKWSERGSCFVISDPHFEDSDCEFMDENWPTPEEYIEGIKGIGKNDTLICLGDVGNPEWFKKIKGYKVLILGNHDRNPEYYKPYFDEIYTGPLMIAEKIILSHEPIPDITWALNIHGHKHCAEKNIDIYHYNVAADVVGYRKISLADIIDKGHLKYIISLHAQIINHARQNSIHKEHERLAKLKKVREVTDGTN